MITHMVLLKVRRDVPRAKLENVFGEIGALQKRIGGIRSYAWGPYSSPEGLHRDYTHGFCMTFTDAAPRARAGQGPRARDPGRRRERRARLRLRVEVAPHPSRVRRARCAEP